jgi:hypothetical protein
MLKEFTLLDILDLARLLRSYLLDSYKVDNLVSFFDFFIRDKDFDLIIANINKYIRVYKTRYLKAS